MVQSVVSLPGNIGTTNMISGPDGDLWVGVSQTPISASIERIGLDGSVISIPVPEDGVAGAFSLSSIATGPDGNVWFDAEIGPNANAEQVVIGKVTPAGVVTEYPPIPVPAGLTATGTTIVDGPGGDLWFGYAVSTSGLKGVKSQTFIGRATTAGAVTLFPVSSFGPGSPVLVTSLVAGADGNLWLTDLGKSKRFDLLRMSPSGAVTPFAIGKLKTGTVASGPDGNLIVTGTTGHLKSAVDSVSTAGAVTRVAIPRAIRRDFGLDLGPAGGSNWFWGGPGPLKIGQLSASGAATSYDLSGSIPGRQHFVVSIVAGPDGNLYLLDDVGQGTSTATLYRLSPGDLTPAD